ncbi:hypothetical protein AC1031_005332 [Aphanomyces cochlioides]|nr:hypothetical protein AC1031_005332 [Aphanomyces cochlioides]
MNVTSMETHRIGGVQFKAALERFAIVSSMVLASVHFASFSEFLVWTTMHHMDCKNVRYVEYGTRERGSCNLFAMELCRGLSLKTLWLLLLGLVGASSGRQKSDPRIRNERLQLEIRIAPRCPRAA